MATNKIKKKLDAIKRFNVKANITDIINKNQEIINDMIRGQLARGKDSKGQDVRLYGKGYYSDATIFDKEHGRYPAIGKITEWITNFRTGAFYSGFNTEAHDSTFTTTSDVPYFDEIISRSGEVIMKLDSSNAKIFRTEVLLPELERRMKAAGI